MQFFLNAAARGEFGGFMDRFASMGFRGARFDVFDEAEFRANIAELARWVRKRPASKHIYLLHGDTAEEILQAADMVGYTARDLGIAEHVIIEPYNEPDLSEAWGENPVGLGAVVAEIWRRLKDTGVELVSPGVSNVSAEALEYAKTMLEEIPLDVAFAFHRYVGSDLTEPHHDYESRGDEIGALNTIAGERRIYCTETGQTEVHQRRKPFPLCLSKEKYLLSEDEIARQIALDAQVWAESGDIEGVVYYQMNDGPDDIPLHKFGWRHHDEPPGGPWKAVAQVMPPIIKELDPEGNPPIKSVTKPQIIDARIHEPETGRDMLPISISLFYGLSLGIDRARFTATIDGLKGKVQEARLSMSTYGWGNDAGEPEVDPFLEGTNKINPVFLDEMEWRIDYMTNAGIRPQVTLFWGGFKEKFVRSTVNKLLKDRAIEDFERAAMRRLRDHPACTVEWMNEIDHGHHMAFMGHAGRVEVLRRHIPFCKEEHPDALIGVSDGGHQPVDEDGNLVNGEGGTYFAYHSIPELDFWNVHFPRDKVEVERIPRWCRGLWHLSGEFFEFRQEHPGKGYGRNDENIFLQTPEQHQQWPYNNSTRDWRMYLLQMYVALTAKAPTTIHSMAGFFCWPEAGTEPVVDIGARAFTKLLEGVPLNNLESYNSEWTGSPVRGYAGPFKAFSLVSGDDRASIIITVLNPREGTLTLDLRDKRYTLEAFEITGERIEEASIGPGERVTYTLPPTNWEHGCILKLTTFGGAT